MKKVEIHKTTEILVPNENDNIEQELREMTKEALLIRLKYEETDPKIMKLIKKIIKEKDHE